MLLPAFLGCAVCFRAHLGKGKAKRTPCTKLGCPETLHRLLEGSSAHPPTSTGPTNFSLLLTQLLVTFYPAGSGATSLSTLSTARNRGAGKEPGLRAVKEELVLADLAMYPILYQYPGKGEKPLDREP